MPYPNYILDVNSGGGEDFTTIASAESGMQADFDNTQPVTLSCRAGTEQISSVVTWAGWITPTGANTVTIQADAGAEHGGVVDGPSYIIELTAGFAYLFDIQIDLMVFDGIQVISSNASSNTQFYSAVGDGTIVRNVIGSYRSSGNRSAMYFVQEVLEVYNCLYLANHGGGSTGGLRLVGGVAKGNTLIGGGSFTGFLRSAGTPILNDNVAVGFATDYQVTGWGAGSNNASGDTTASDNSIGTVTGVVTTTGVDFVDPATLDYNPEPAGKLDDAGIYFAEIDPDIAGNARGNPTCEIGAYEIAGGPVTESLITGAVQAQPAMATGQVVSLSATFVGPDIVDQNGTDTVLFVFDENSEGDVDSRFVGTSTYALSPVSSPLPAGLTVNASTGNIEGTPTVDGVFPSIVIRGT